MQITSKVLQGQSFLDKVLELSGSIEQCMVMALINNKSITSDLAINEQITTNRVAKQGVVNYLTHRQPATGLARSTGLSQEYADNLLGIDYWAIEVDFEVK